MICKANLGGCFSNPEGYGRNATFFTGENQFKVTEMEVFKSPYSLSLFKKMILGFHKNHTAN